MGMKYGEFETGHNDRVTVLHVNFDGSKILTASIDHRVKIWSRDKITGERKLVDTFTAHDADIRDAKFLHPTTGTHIATIGNDLKFHLWSEDPSQAPNSGRRFRRISTISSTPRVPFVSLDLKTVEYTTTYLALIDRQGLLSIYEPSNPDEFKDWTLLDQFNVCIPPPGRGEETCFKVRFDPNSPPLPYMNSLSEDQNQLSLVVTALNEVKIYRSSSSSSSTSSPYSKAYNPNDLNPSQGIGNNNNTGASHRLVFHESAKLPTHPNLVRDVTWSPFSIRGVDRIATACKDGTVRIFDLSIIENPEISNIQQSPSNINNNNHRRSNSTSQQAAGYNNNNDNNNFLSTGVGGGGGGGGGRRRGGGGGGGGGGGTGQTRPQQSSLTSAITGNTNTNPNTNLTTSSSSSPQTRTHQFPFLTKVNTTAILSNAHPDVWSVLFDPAGQILLSCGSDGVTKLWRRSIVNSSSEVDHQGGIGGKWMLFADQAVEIEDEDVGEEGFDDDGDDDNDDDEGGDDIGGRRGGGGGEEDDQFNTKNQGGRRKYGMRKHIQMDGNNIR